MDDWTTFAQRLSWATRSQHFPGLDDFSPLLAEASFDASAGAGAQPTIAAVPEPVGLATLLIGFSLLCSRIRHKR